MPSRNGAENVASASAARPDFCRPVQVKAMAAARSSLPSPSVIGATAVSVLQPGALVRAAPSGPFSGQSHSRNSASADGRLPNPLTTMPCVCLSCGDASFQLDGGSDG